MERKEATHSEDPIYRASSSSTSLHVDRGKGIKYEGGDRQEEGDGYDVFLSFKMEDTGRGFTDHLFSSLVDAGIRVFRDDNELRVGEEIGPDLLNSITQSKISIPIISENYASSSWCLRELALMLKCKSSGGVLPIFYKVELSHLRSLQGRFGDAINAHKRNLDEMVVKEWERALKEVTYLKGWESEKIDDRHEATLVKMVVRRVRSKLKRFFKLIVPRHLVGIDERVEDIMSLIDTKFDGTSIIGIYGMGGIGKTTLAKALYNKLFGDFEYLSFVANIRETSRRHKGIEYLQKQFISDIIRSSYDLSDVNKGINFIRSRFTSRKVLILLDDVDNITQLHALCVDGSCFEAGSIVIITTRNKSILNNVGAGYMYKLRELSQEQSLILFSRYAFQKAYPQTGYEDISRGIVLTTSGLPLALEIIGSSLRGMTIDVWEHTLNKLKEVPNREVQNILKISYEALDHAEQQIFLDVACFFIGSSKQSPTYMWDSCGFFEGNGIEVLSSMSLMEVDEDGKLMMHDQMRNLGREIVRLENPEEPQERSRLWNHEDAMDVLDNNKGTSKIKALRLDEYSCRSFKSEQFKELTNLRFLQVNGVNFTGDFQNLLPQLRWLQWQACPSDFVAANFHPKELVVLNLSWSEISEDWGGWGPLKMAIELRVLNLSHCHFLRRTPNLSAFERLEILILEDCDNLEGIHSSIGDIKTLVSLNVKRCGRLEELPEQIGFLTSLTQLDVSHSGIKELPESIGFLKKLNTLDASYCASLAWIPNSIGHLASLQHLLLQECCSLIGIPDSIEQLESLIELHLKSTAIVELPQNNRNLQKSRILEIRGTGVAKLPGAISHIDKDTESMANVKPGIANESEDNEPLQSQSVRLPDDSTATRDTESMVDMKSEIVNESRDKSRNWKPTEIDKPLQCQSDIESMANVMPRIADESGDKSRNWKQTEIDEPLQCSIRLPDNSTAKRSIEKIKDEAGRQPVDMGNSDKSYAIASVQKLVGIDDRAKQMIDLLEMEVNDEVRIIGIYGTDGIGKTTLAKAVYDKISSYFDSCSFLVEVDETTQNSHDIQFSQTKLIRDILALDREDPSSDERIEIFVDIFRKMKVLIVVDGVQNQSHLHAIVGDQLDWFGPGSRIIVTSQNEEILKEYDPEKTRTYMVSKLDDGQAFELFCKHAHTMTSQYDGLAYGIVNATEKLPLAVEVVGSFLRGRSIQEWKKMEKSMSSQKTTVGVQQILDICYKELDQQRKDIFLDIACFISGVDARIASYMWPSCYLPSSGCILMPLAKIGENNELQMHRLLRCLGKRVFKQEESQDPSSRRFCTQDMVLKAMNREKGVENVEAGDACTLTAANFVSMPAISFLKLDDAKVHGDFTGAFPSLRWFHW